MDGFCISQRDRQSVCLFFCSIPTIEEQDEVDRWVAVVLSVPVFYCPLTHNPQLPGASCEHVV